MIYAYINIIIIFRGNFWLKQKLHDLSIIFQFYSLESEILIYGIYMFAGQKRSSVHLRCYQPKVAISDDGTVVIEIFAIVTGSVSALILVPMNDHHFLVLGIACDSIARSLDLWVAILRRGRWIVYHHIVNEPVFSNSSQY